MIPAFRFAAAGTALAIAASVAASAPAAAQTLEEALAQAYATNPRLLAERAALRATDEGVPTALSGWRPTVQITSGVGRRYLNNKPDTGPSSSSTTLPYDAGLTISQPLYRGGATVAETQAAEALVLAGRANLQDVEQQVLLDAVTAYMSVVRDGSVVELNVNNEQVLERQLQAARDRFEVGEVTRTDVSQAEARLSDAQALRVEAEGNLEISRANFLRAVGALPEKLESPDLSAMMSLPESRDAARSVAEQRNPSVLRAGFLERSALHDISAAGAQLLPQVSLDGTLSRSMQPSSFFERSDVAELSANVTVPLYQSGAEYARVRELRQTAVQRRRELDDARRAVREAVEQSWERLMTTRARIRAFESSVNANEIALDGVQQEAAVGARTVLDVLDAEQELFQARVNLVGAQADEVVDSFTLLQVVGMMTAGDLGLPVDVYDPVTHYDEVRDKWIGFGSDYQGGSPFELGLD
jgi:outer membrane protein